MPIISMGIQVHFGKVLRRFLGDERVTGLRFNGGTGNGGDMIVFAYGFTPNVELAREAGL